MIGWDEILEGGLAENATVMAWRGVEHAVTAARTGHDAVLTPTSHTYFDYYQSSDTAQEPLAIGGFLPLDRVYTWEPMPAGLALEHRHHILGVQAQLWTEYMPDSRQVEYMAWPRLSALAEVAWTPPALRDLEGFRQRLAPHLDRLRALDVNFRAADLTRPIYKDSTRPVEERVRDLVGRMTLEEKFWQLFMMPGDLDDPAHDYSNGVFGLQIRTKAADARAHAERINAIQRYFVEHTRLGIPIIPFEEALHGFHMRGRDDVPAGDRAGGDVGRGPDGSRVGGHRPRDAQPWHPAGALAGGQHRDDVRWGRVEETYGEDPYLSSVMGRAFVGAFERAGVDRDPETLRRERRRRRTRQLSDRAQRAAADGAVLSAVPSGAPHAGARSVMTAYNSVDGSPGDAEPAVAQRDILKGDWRFRGFVISDAAATGGATVLHMTEANTATAAKHAFEAGLDVVFQSSWPQHRPTSTPFQARTRSPHPIIDAAVARVLRGEVRARTVRAAVRRCRTRRRESNGHADHRALAREAARASIVLLTNDRQPAAALEVTAPVGRGDRPRRD